jgi:hypothetical protein
MTDDPQKIDIDQVIHKAMPARPQLKGDIKVDLEPSFTTSPWSEKLRKTSSIMFSYWLVCSGVLAGYFYLFPVNNGPSSAPIVITAACIVVSCFLLIHVLMKYAKGSISDVLFKALE